MKQFILILILFFLFFLLKTKEKFSLDEVTLKQNFPELIKDDTEIYLQKYQCLDFEDIKI